MVNTVVSQSECCGFDSPSFLCGVVCSHCIHDSIRWIEKTLKLSISMNMSDFLSVLSL